MVVQAVNKGLVSLTLTPRECGRLAKACGALQDAHVTEGEGELYVALETWGELFRALELMATLQMEIDEEDWRQAEEEAGVRLMK